MIKNVDLIKSTAIIILTFPILSLEFLLALPIPSLLEVIEVKNQLNLLRYVKRILQFKTSI